MNKRYVFLVVILILGSLLACSFVDGDGDVSNDTDCITVDEVQGKNQIQAERQKQRETP